MSRFTKDEQTEIVRWAMNLEAAIQSEETELSRLKSEKFKSVPSAPVRKTVNMNVATVAPDYSALPQVNYAFADFLGDDVKTKPTLLNKLFSAHPFKRALIVCVICSILGLVLGIFSIKNQLMFLVALILELIASFVFPAAVIYWIVKRSEYTSKKKWLAVQLTQTPAYIQAKTEAERIAQQKQAAIVEDLRTQQANLDSQYAREKEHYDLVVLPQYNNDLEKWNTAHDLKIRVITDDLNTNIRILAELYDESCLISKNNRTLQKLVWLYEDMSTSEHDIERATDLLNADQQLAATREITSSINNMHNDVMSGMYAIYKEIEAGNDIKDEMLGELKKMRRDINIGTGIGTVQRHNTNKQLKNFSKEFEELRKKFN